MARQYFGSGTAGITALKVVVATRTPLLCSSLWGPHQATEKVMSSLTIGHTRAVQWLHMGILGEGVGGGCAGRDVQVAMEVCMEGCGS
jgi:hypothetical protein